jgi:hypothetical protein
MTFRGRDFDARNDEKVIDRLAIVANETFFSQILDAVVRVVIGERESVQTFGARRGDIFLGSGNAVAGKERVRVQVDLERHERSVVARCEMKSGVSA